MEPRTNHNYQGSAVPEKKIIHPNTNCRPSKSIHNESIYVINPGEDRSNYQSIQSVRKRRGWIDPT